MAAVTSAIVGTLVAVAGAYASVKQAEVADEAAREQIEMAKDRNEAAKAEVAEQKAQALTQRKSLIDVQRKKMLGNFNLNPTGAAGVLPVSGLLNSAPNYNTLTGVTLG